MQHLTWCDQGDLQQALFVVFFPWDLHDKPSAEVIGNDSSSLRNTIQCRVRSGQRSAGGTSPASTVTLRSVTHSGKRGLEQMQLLPRTWSCCSHPCCQLGSSSVQGWPLARPQKHVGFFRAMNCWHMSCDLGLVTRLLRNEGSTGGSGLRRTGKRRSKRLVLRLQHFHSVTWIHGKNMNIHNFCGY